MLQHIKGRNIVKRITIKGQNAKRQIGEHYVFLYIFTQIRAMNAVGAKRISRIGARADIQSR